MKIMDIFTSIKPYYRQPQGRVWLLAIAVVSLLLVLTFIYQGYNSFELVKHMVFQAEVVPTPGGKPTQSNTDQLAKAPLFGVASTVASTRVNTNLLLLGVFLANDGKRSQAIIANQGEEAKVYRVSDQLADGGKLYSVYADRVMLQRNGQLETLYLEWEKRSEESPSKKPSARKIHTPKISGKVNTNLETDKPAVQPVTPSFQVENPPNNSEAWQDRIKEIREKYQGRFGSQGGGPGYNPRSLPSGDGFRGMRNNR